jgi:hypothetical protein
MPATPAVGVNRASYCMLSEPSRDWLVVFATPSFAYCGCCALAMARFLRFRPVGSSGGGSVRYRLVLHINSAHSVLYHCAKIFTGLDALVRRGLLRLQVKVDQESPTRVLFLDALALDTNARRLLGFDLSDHSTFLCAAGLAQCDVYFKRNLYRPHTEGLLPEQRSKIVPFGLNYACAGRASRAWVLGRWCCGVAKTLRRSPRDGVSRLRRWLGELWEYARLKDAAAFEQDPDAFLLPAVLFQTRVWPPEKTTENLDRINEERVALIRTLRKALGARFRGGIVPTPFARRHYPDVLLPDGYRHEGYIQVMQRYLVGITTRGLHDSIPFKLPEYLAASLCVVTEPLRNELPQPLVAGQHYLEFRSHDECVAQCERLLSHPAEAREMRWHNFDYYRRWVAPGEHLLDCLDRAFGDGGARPSEPAAGHVGALLVFAHGSVLAPFVCTIF